MYLLTFVCLSVYLFVCLSIRLSVYYYLGGKGRHTLRLGEHMYIKALLTFKGDRLYRLTEEREREREREREIFVIPVIVYILNVVFCFYSLFF